MRRIKTYSNIFIIGKAILFGIAFLIFNLSKAQILPSSLKISGTSNERVDVFTKSGKIKKFGEIYPLSHTTIEIISDGKVVKKTESDSKGNFVIEFDIYQNKIYDIKYSKSGFYSKMSRFKTLNCENELVYSYEDWNFALRKKVDGLEKPKKLIPFEVYYYDKEVEEFSEDLEYSENYDEIQKEVYANIEKEVMANDAFADIRDKALRNLKAELSSITDDSKERQLRIQEQSKKIISEAKVKAKAIISNALDSASYINEQNKLIKEKKPVIEYVYIDSSKTTIKSKQEFKQFKEQEVINEENINLASLDVLRRRNEIEAARKQLELDRLTAQTKEDSMLIAQRQMQILEAESGIAEYESKIKDANSQIEIKNAELKSQKVYLFGSLAVLVIIVGFLAIVFRLFKQKQKVNILLEDQNKEIAEIHEDIVSSIRYAKRIQTAILPPKDFISSKIKNDYFVLYKPKDIVSGDFYWLDEKDGKVIISAIDCTGHGVPGAFMSMIGYNSLNKGVKEYGLTKPSEILNAQNKFIAEALRKSTNKTIRDGMDMSLLAIDYKKMKVEFAGAYNPLYIVRGEEFIHIKSDNIAIGSYFQNPEREYTNHEIDLKKGDRLYIFTDGYADQFGGPDFRKFMYRRFREVLLETNNETMDNQRMILWKRLMDWKGYEEQIDDICVIGIEI